LRLKGGEERKSVIVAAKKESQLVALAKGGEGNSKKEASTFQNILRKTGLKLEERPLSGRRESALFVN